MSYKVLFGSKDSDFKKLAYFKEVELVNREGWKYKVTRLVIVATKELVSEETLVHISDVLIDNEIVKDDFAVYNIYVTDKQVNLVNKIDK
jgi:hypothetical protein